MRNTIGNPAVDENFFPRPREMRKLVRVLESKGNILLIAPRRVGKTSLTIRLCDDYQQNGWSTVFLNVEGCEDELAFAEKLVDELHRQKLNPDITNRAKGALRTIRKAVGGIKVGVGFDIEVSEVEDIEYSTVNKTLESIFRKIDGSDKKVLIAIDEMPELLLALNKHDDGKERVGRLLHWLRSLRQTHRNQIQWIFLGSIGLDGFVDERNLGKTINDLTTVSLEALSDDEAHAFLEKLGDDNELPLSPAIRTKIIECVGWSLIYHLQVVFHALLSDEPTTVDEAAVDAAFKTLLRPENLNQFDTWRQRIDDQFNVADAALAKGILNHVCQHNAGRTRAQILAALLTARPSADADTIDNQLGHLLQILQKDGYLLRTGDSYAFRSFLLRQYWYHREVL